MPYICGKCGKIIMAEKWLVHKKKCGIGTCTYSVDTSKTSWTGITC